MPHRIGSRVSTFQRLSALVLALVFILLSISCSGFKNRKNEAKAHYLRGVSLLSSNRVQDAYVEFEKSLLFNPNDKETHNALGNIYIRLVEFRKAEKHFKKAVRIDRKYSEAYNNLCFIYYEQDMWKDAIKNCNRALKNKLYTTPAKAYYNLGRSYYRSGKYPEAAEAFTSAIKRYPEGVQVYYALALAYNAQKKYGKASKAMNKAVKNDSRFKGNISKADKEFRKQRNIADNPKDLDDYIEILKY
jgi:Flp pilus assembly protein TadD